MPLDTFARARCDIPGCKSSVEGDTVGGLEFDITTAADLSFRWEVICGIVRCPACVAADRWPDGTVGTSDGVQVTDTPWIDGPEQGTTEPTVVTEDDGGLF